MTENNGTGTNKLAGISIGLNIILAIGLIILYILFFNKQNGKSVQENADMPQLPVLQGGEGSNVAFVNTDVLLDKYDLVKQMANEFEKERRKRDADLKSKSSQYEEEATYFQQAMQNQSLSEESAQKIYNQLMEKQQALYELQQQYSDEMAQQDYEMTSVLIDTVKNFLHRMNLDKNYDYIFNNSVASPVLLTRDTLDITNFVLKGLNAEYQKHYNPDED